MIVKVYVLVSVLAIGLAQDYNCGSSTPRNLETHFKSNCTDLGLDTATCTQAWSAFSGAFSNKNPSTVNPTDYQPYFDVIPIATDKDQCLFWSGTFDLMTIISMMISNENIQLASSANVLSSAIINNLGDDTIWCGREGAGIDYDNVCLCSVTTKFWDQFSLLFSQSAKGTVFFLGDGERSVGAYSRTSTFGRVELPNLDANVVTRVVALIIHRQDYGDSCLYNSGSIMLLRNDVTARSLQFDCYDIYGQANNSTHIKAIAGCVSNVISQVQDGMETEERQIECSVNGAGFKGISFIFIFGILTITLFVDLSY